MIQPSHHPVRGVGEHEPPRFSVPNWFEHLHFSMSCLTAMLTLNKHLYLAGACAHRGGGSACIWTKLPHACIHTPTCQLHGMLTWSTFSEKPSYCPRTEDMTSVHAQVLAHAHAQSKRNKLLWKWYGYAQVWTLDLWANKAWPESIQFLYQILKRRLNFFLAYKLLL